MLNWVKNITYFFLLFSVINNVLPSEEYKKYVRFYGGIVLIILLFRPVQTVTDMEGKLDEKYQKFSAELNGKEIEEKIQAKLYENVSEYYERVIETELNSRLKTYGYQAGEVSVKVREGEENPQIDQISLTLEKYQDSTTEKIEKVEVKITEEQESEQMQQVTQNLKKYLNDFYNLTETHIHITIMR